MPPLARACCDESRGSFDECEPAVVAVGMWKSRAFCGISKRGGNGGKVALAFGLFHGFHGASFPQRVSGSMLLRSFAVFSPTNSAEEPFFLTERYANVIENKGTLWKTFGRSWNVYENTGT